VLVEDGFLAAYVLVVDVPVEDLVPVAFDFLVGAEAGVELSSSSSSSSLCEAAAPLFLSAAFAALFGETLAFLLSPVAVLPVLAPAFLASEALLAAGLATTDGLTTFFPSSYLFN